MIDRNFVKIIENNLKKEAVILLQTDTVLGLVCVATSNSAVQKIYALKKRSFNKPLSLLASNVVMAMQYIETSDLIIKLLNDDVFSITVIAQQTPNPAHKLSAYINSQDTGKAAACSFAIRIPKEPNLIEIINNLQLPIVATSANLSGETILPAIKAKKLFGQNIQYYGLSSNHSNIPSIIIDCRTDIPKILRATKEQKLYLYEKHFQST